MMIPMMADQGFNVKYPVHDDFVVNNIMFVKYISVFRQISLCDLFLVSNTFKYLFKIFDISIYKWNNISVHSSRI